MGDVRYLDQSGVYALADLIADLQKVNTEVYIAELHEEPRDLLARLGVTPGTVAGDRIFESAEEAILAAAKHEKLRLASEGPPNSAAVVGA